MPIPTSELLALFADGLTVRQLSAHFGVSHQRISQLIRSRTGMSARQHRPPQCQCGYVGSGEHGHRARMRVRAEARAEELFWSHVAKSEGCWEWTAGRARGGYGSTTLRRSSTRRGRTYGRMAHRVAYELLVGPIPPGLTLDHLCRNRGCVNPAHLEPVTLQENIMRSPNAVAAVNARKTHCPHGRPYRIGANGDRVCGSECPRWQPRVDADVDV